MDRKQFLKTTGGALVVSMLPGSRASVAAENKAAAPANADAPSCMLSPAVNEGPFYLDAQTMRQNIVETSTGLPLEYSIKVVDAACEPIAGVLVDIWQCDKDGVYSGYAGQPGGLDTTGKTFLRGIQTTDAQGMVKFIAIYPGWYPNRLTHLHVKLHFNNQTVITTNLFYPDAINNAVYAGDLYKAKGPNPTTVANDVELHGDNTRFQNLTMAFTPLDAGGYTAAYTFGIAATPTDLRPAHPENGGQFRLDKNFPNPVAEITNFSFAIKQSSLVTLTVEDLNGMVVERISQERFGAGEHRLVWHRSQRALPAGAYLFALSLENQAGRFRQTMPLLLK